MSPAETLMPRVGMERLVSMELKVLHKLLLMDSVLQNLLVLEDVLPELVA